MTENSSRPLVDMRIVSELGSTELWRVSNASVRPVVTGLRGGDSSMLHLVRLESGELGLGVAWHCWALLEGKSIISGLAKTADLSKE